MTYPNGQIPASALEDCNGYLFTPPAAWGLAMLDAAYRAEFGTAIPISQGYRALGTPDDSPDLSPATQWSVWRKYLRDGSPLAAHPGTSNHGWGIAADLGYPLQTKGTPQRNWLLTNGPRYGWHWGEVPNELWHFTFRGLTAAAQKEYDAMQDDIAAIKADTAAILANQTKAAEQAKRIRIANQSKLREIAKAMKAADKATAKQLDDIADALGVD